METRDGSAERDEPIVREEAQDRAPADANGASARDADEGSARDGTPARDENGASARDENGAPARDEAQELSRRERERLVRRRLMLDAARAVFAEKGYADATLEEIAQRAEFGKGTLYNYFEGGKEEILFAVFDDLYAALHEVIARTFSPELIHERPFRAVFEGFLTAILSFFVERQDQFMIMLKEGHRMVFNEEPEKAAYFQEQSDSVIDVLVPTIDEAKRAGSIRDFPSQSVAHMIMGNVKGYHMHMCMAECRDRRPTEGSVPKPMPAPADSARFLSTFLLDGLLSDQED